MIIINETIIFDNPVEQSLLYWALVEYSLSDNKIHDVIIARDILYPLKKHIDQLGIKYISA